MSILVVPGIVTWGEAGGQTRLAASGAYWLRLTGSLDHHGEDVNVPMETAGSFKPERYTFTDKYIYHLMSLNPST